MEASPAALRKAMTTESAKNFGAVLASDAVPSISRMETFWNAPVFDGGAAILPLKGLPPSTLVALHTYFFMPCDAGTHGPPDSLHPGEPAMASSRPSRSARVVAYWKASFHSGVI